MLSACNYIPAKQMFSGFYWYQLSVSPSVCQSVSVRVSIWVQNTILMEKSLASSVQIDFWEKGR